VCQQFAQTFKINTIDGEVFECSSNGLKTDIDIHLPWDRTHYYLRLLVRHYTSLLMWQELSLFGTQLGRYCKKSNAQTTNEIRCRRVEKKSLNQIKISEK
jgi:hypothetical protein